MWLRYGLAFSLGAFSKKLLLFGFIGFAISPLYVQSPMLQSGIVDFSPEHFTAAHWLFFAAVVLVAFVVRGFTGFGSSALCVALLTAIIPPAVVVPLVFMMELVASLWLLPGSWRHIDMKWLRPSVIGVLIGMPPGLWLLATLDAETAQLCVYALLVVLATANLFRARGAVSLPMLPPMLVGVLAGVANGLAAVAGMVMVLFLLASSRPPATVRASLIAMFLITDLYGLAWGGGLGIVHAAHAVLLPPALVLMSVAVLLGGRLFAKSDGRAYRLLALSLVLAAAALGVARLAVIKFL